MITKRIVMRIRGKGQAFKNTSLLGIRLYYNLSDKEISKEEEKSFNEMKFIPKPSG